MMCRSQIQRFSTGALVSESGEMIFSHSFVHVPRLGSWDGNALVDSVLVWSI